MLVEFLLQNAFLASATLFLGGSTAFMWIKPGDSLALDAHETVMKVNQDNALVVDLRAKAEYDKGFIPGSRQMNASEIEAKAGELAKKRPVVLVCANGATSVSKARKLHADGIENITALKGGFRSWLDAGQPTHKKK